MTTATLAAPMTRAENHSSSRPLLMAQVVIFLIPLIVLGQAIGWPASLRLPAAEALPLIARKRPAVQIGYWGYLVTAVALVPLVTGLAPASPCARASSGLLVDTMAASASRPAVLKTLGIVRWLIAMPTLATLYARHGDPIVRAGGRGQLRRAQRLCRQRRRVARRAALLRASG